MGKQAGGPGRKERRFLLDGLLFTSRQETLLFEY